jgi:hypothetical protein
MGGVACNDSEQPLYATGHDHVAPNSTGTEAPLVLCRLTAAARSASASIRSSHYRTTQNNFDSDHDKNAKSVFFSSFPLELQYFFVVKKTSHWPAIRHLVTGFYCKSNVGMRQVFVQQ